VIFCVKVIKNASNLLAGNPSALSILSAEGYFVSFMGNAMLMSYFVSRGERGAVLIQVFYFNPSASTPCHQLIWWHSPSRPA
jgi:lipid-A-disaccharide synthase-like uncharacterized protein